MLKIAKYPDPILRKTAKSISDFNDYLKKLAADMAEAMYHDDGIGLAAPQISQSLRLVVLGLGKGQYKSYVNPEITFFSKEKISSDEGCLSLPKIFGTVTRAKKIHIKYHDVDGQIKKEKIKGLGAIVLQHEVDHLNGILFIDRAEKITEGQAILDSLKKKLNEQIK
ncbi:MAG: peptide deformylase [Candidatus Komeilibacteria bacterium RIFOXYC1_FULL_37_11]|uniref:Peptide deformylase n=1 Tax=Candidatus Komeilibacteria bacterium RIFOXYC1_FULL_37_11 TaxID=1798555 RepID=A0A1G2C1G9_9BACT|nr:MAG: peptide deformylase [Candidatus Komeilibacteria bacterium RIFOXYC1_FULL_37_11]OGY95508.1 MAG: peptide deformylase [Candidatus Komeilibacteria bacterium RIFOXYD1_FULL_37_29]